MIGLDKNLKYRWWPEAESNHRHDDFQSSALPTELSGHFLNEVKLYLNKFNTSLFSVRILQKTLLYVCMMEIGQSLM